ncbi:MAG: hypothetical protein IKP50_01765 [Bacilli bacterium]|nr:hypothetical protein [Bacilli bacterium]
MKKIKISLAVISLVLCGCQKKYNYNKECYIKTNYHYVERCEQFIDHVQSDKGCDIVFLGDSITEGYPLHIFFNEYKVANRGINGDTTGGVIDRLEFSVYDLNPKVIYLMIGTNNLQTCLENYETILKGIKNYCPRSKVMLMSITPRWGEDLMAKIREINVEIQKYAENYGYFYANVFTPLTVNSENLVVNDELFADGLHPLTEGYRIITNVIKPTIIEWLKK